MRSDYFVGNLCVLSAALWISGCGPNAEDQKRVERLNKFNAQQGAESALFDLALIEAQMAIAEQNSKKMADSVAQLQKLGDEATERLSDQATDASKSKEDRVLALTLLGEIGPSAKSAADALEAIARQENDAEIKDAAAAAVAKIRVTE